MIFLYFSWKEKGEKIPKKSQLMVLCNTWQKGFMGSQREDLIAALISC